MAARRLLPLTSRNVVLMKTVLSYHHACKMSKPGQKATIEIPESFVHFMVPLCTVVTRGASATFTPQPANAPPTAGAAVATASPTAAAAGSGAVSREQTIERMIEELVEMFEGALDAGLKALVDPRELADDSKGGGGGQVAANIPLRDKKTSSNRPPKTTKVPRGPRPSSAEESISGDKDTPAWVDVVYNTLVPGFQDLLDHITRVHLGLVVAPVPKDVRRYEDVAEDSKGETGGAPTTAVSKDATEGNKDGERSAENVVGGTNAVIGDNGPPRPESTEKEEDKIGEEGNQRTEASGPTSLRRKSSLRESLIAARRKSTAAAAAAAVAAAAAKSTVEEKVDATLTPVRLSSSPAPSEGSGERGAIELPKVGAVEARVALCVLLQPLVSVGLVGHLSLDACLFAWDQAVIGGFDVMLPRLAAMVVAAAGDKLEACWTFARMSESLLSHTYLVSVRSFTFFGGWRCRLHLKAKNRKVVYSSEVHFLVRNSKVMFFYCTHL